MNLNETKNNSLSFYLPLRKKLIISSTATVAIQSNELSYLAHYKTVNRQLNFYRFSIAIDKNM